MHIITLAGSEHQKSRLRNGHKVRVKHGKGFNVIVSPNTYHLVSRSFNKMMLNNQIMYLIFK